MKNRCHKMIVCCLQFESHSCEFNKKGKQLVRVLWYL